MISLFFDQIPHSVVEIEKAARENKFDIVRAIAHKINPAIDNMGISSVYIVVRGIEKYADSAASRETLFANIFTLRKVINTVTVRVQENECIV